MKILLSVCLGLFLTGASASAAQKYEIWDLLQRIDVELRGYEQSPETLDFVKARLEEALQAMRRGSVPNPQACVDFAFEEYRKDGYSGSASLEKAGQLCRKMERQGSTLPVLRFFFGPLVEDGYSRSTSLDQALGFSRRVSESDLPCLRSSYERYRIDGFSKRTALEKSAAFCAR